LLFNTIMANAITNLSFIPQDTVPQVLHRTTNMHLKKQDIPLIDTVDHKKIDTLGYFFHKLVIEKPSPDAILFNAVADAPEFFVDSVILAQRKELTTHYDEFKYYMKNINHRPDSKFSGSKDWISLVLFVIAIFLLITKRIKGNFLSLLTQVALKYREFTKSASSTNVADINVSNLLSVVYIFSVSLLIYLIFEFFNYFFLLKTFYFFFFLVAFIFLLLLLKRILIYLSGFFLSQKDLAFKYNKNIQLFNNTLGLLIIPFILAIPFVEEVYIKFLIYSSISLIVLFYLIRILRSVKIFIEYNVSIFYMILYLCTLEILPNLLMYKILEMFYTRLV